MSSRPTPWQKIIRAGNNRRSLRLTKEEVELLWMDHAIRTVAERDDAATSQPPPPPEPRERGETAS